MNYIHLESTLSTNAFAKEIAASGDKCTTLIIADKQTGGRGRLGRGFFSPDGGLYMSLLFFPAGCAEMISLFTPLMALAVTTAVYEIFGEETNIKWVNDIYFHEKKLCGILAEAEPNNHGGVNYAVIGVGLNISEPQGGFDASIKDIATALLPCGTDISAYKEKLAFRIAELFLGYIEKGGSYLVEKYRSKLLYVGRKVTVSRFGESYTATVLGVDEAFGLIVCDDDGIKHILHSGEISIRPTED